MTALKLGDAVRHRRLGWRGVVSALLCATPVSRCPDKSIIVRRVTAFGASITAHTADELELIAPMIDAGLTADESLVDLTALDLGGRVVPFKRPALRLVTTNSGDDVA